MTIPSVLENDANSNTSIVFYQENHNSSSFAKYWKLKKIHPGKKFNHNNHKFLNSSNQFEISCKYGGGKNIKYLWLILAWTTGTGSNIQMVQDSTFHLISNIIV